MNDGCYGCTKRTMTCHDDCEQYREWKANHDQNEAIKREAKRAIQELDGYAVDQVRRRRRGKAK